MDSKNFNAFTVASVIDVNYNTRIFRFALDKGQSLAFPTASALVVKAPLGEGGKDVVSALIFIFVIAAQPYLNHATFYTARFDLTRRFPPILNAATLICWSNRIQLEL